jgi:hypothetical protein
MCPIPLIGFYKKLTLLFFSFSFSVALNDVEIYTLNLDLIFDTQLGLAQRYYFKKL